MNPNPRQERTARQEIPLDAILGLTGERVNLQLRRVPTNHPGFRQSHCRMVNNSKLRTPKSTADPRRRGSKSGQLQSCIVNRGISTKPIRPPHLLSGPRISDLRVKDISMFLPMCKCQTQRQWYLQPQKRTWTLSLADLEILETETTKWCLLRECSSTPLPSHIPVHSAQQTMTLNLWIWTTRSVCQRHHWARHTGNNFTALQDRATRQTLTCTGEQKAHQ